MFTKLENNIHTVYNNAGHPVGSIPYNYNLKGAKIVVGKKKYTISCNKLTTEILAENTVILRLKMNSFSGNLKVLETKQKITGVFGFKWGTKMMDPEKNTLLKIRNKNIFLHNDTYLIKVLNAKTTDLDILLTLYGHLKGGASKEKITIGITILAVIVSEILF